MIYKNVFPGGKTRALTLSYDDGIAQDLRLMDILRKHHIKATFNINAGKLNGETYHRAEDGTAVRRLLPEEVQKNYADFEIAVHTYHHPFLAQMPKDLMTGEIYQDRLALEKLAGYPVRGMAYPFGVYNDEVMGVLKEMGIVYARTVHSTEAFDLPKDFLAWHPTCHHNHPHLEELCDRFLQDTSRTPLKTFYLWGHSYEFDMNDNWHVMERFCEKMADHEDIWYATNIEIYDYVQALNRLVSSVDGSMLMNPSAVDVWVSRDDRALCVPAGQTVRV